MGQKWIRTACSIRDVGQQCTILEQTSTCSPKQLRALDVENNIEYDSKYDAGSRCDYNISANNIKIIPIKFMLHNKTAVKQQGLVKKKLKFE